MRRNSVIEDYVLDAVKRMRYRKLGKLLEKY